ncbi:MAG: L,D-transpeptidase [Flavobacteriales bacterium]|nr:L,D-transpeptidase [Flavobacteriales bacterium]
MIRKENIQFCLFIACFSILYSCKNNQIVRSPYIVGNPPIDETIYHAETEPKNETIADFLTEYLNLKYPGKRFEKFIYVSIKYQKLYYIENKTVVKKYPVSTSKYGIGNKLNSNQTPLGLHSIKQKIGDNVPVGGLFSSRDYTGRLATILNGKVKSKTDDVTSRILWLHGEEIGVNRGRDIDSYKRYIYIHGTSEEGYIGEPASHGCIRMKNTDVIDLYNLVNEETLVIILKA